MQSNTYREGMTIQVSISGITANIDPKSITPPGITNGDEIDTTTQSNSAYKTKYPRKLLEVSDASFTAAWNIAGWDELTSVVGQNGEIVFTFPDDSTLTVWGYLKEFTPGEFAEGEMPVADATIVITNENSSGTETAPVVSAGSV